VYHILNVYPYKTPCYPPWIQQQRGQATFRLRAAFTSLRCEKKVLSYPLLSCFRVSSGGDVHLLALVTLINSYSKLWFFCYLNLPNPGSDLRISASLSPYLWWQWGAGFIIILEYCKKKAKYNAGITKSGILVFLKITNQSTYNPYDFSHFFIIHMILLSVLGLPYSCIPSTFSANA
jgi:hypothetical protein